VPLVKHATSLAVAAWALLLVGVLVAPRVLSRPDPGDDLIRNTIRLSLAFYAVAVGLMLFLQPGEWAGNGRGGFVRCCWSLAWVTYLVHLGMAFHYYHGWSHADAIRHTEEVSGFGPGIYASHLFTLLWTLDVLWWWRRPVTYARRAAWIGRTLHAFMAFIVFNGTVVYETGLIRWAGAGTFVVLGGLWLLARARPAVAVGVSELSDVP
jgi:hypothetical protein